MQGRQITNTVAGGVGVFSLLGIVLPNVFKWIGWVEWAQGLGAVFTLFSDPRIHWQGVYLLILCVATSALVMTNFRVMHQVLSHWAFKRRPQPISAYKAVIWICYWTHLGGAWNDAQKFDAGLATLAEAGRTGKLKFMGCALGHLNLTNIPASAFSGATLAMYEMDAGHSGALALIKRPNDELVYTGLVVDRKRVENLWPGTGREGFIW